MESDMRAFAKPRQPKKLLLAIVGLAVTLSWLPQLDNIATGQVDAGLQRALISFASARALNAAISVAQGTEAAIEPAGVGFTFAPGQVLDPVNDLVEKFSDLMLLASVSFGVQKVLLSIGAHWLTSFLVTAIAIYWARFIVFDRPVYPWLSRLLIVLVAIRFALPLITLGSDQIFQHFLSTEYQTSQDFIDSSSQEIEGLSQADTTAAQQTIFERLRSWSQNINLESPVETLKNTADRTIEHIVNLMVIFVLQTLLLPLLLLWAITAFVKRLFHLSTTRSLDRKEARGENH